MYKYFNYLGVDVETLSIDFPTLCSVYKQHLEKFPYSNALLYLSSKSYHPVVASLDRSSLIERLVDANRGGYCYENAELLHHALKYVGFEVERLSTHVPLCPSEDKKQQIEYRSNMPSTHNILAVKLDGIYWLLDPGMFPFSLLAPFPFTGKDEIVKQKQGVLEFRLHQISKKEPYAGEWVLDGYIQGTEKWVAILQFKFDFCSREDTKLLNHKLYYYKQNVGIRDNYLIYSGLIPNSSGIYEIKGPAGKVLLYKQYNGNTVIKNELAWKEGLDYMFEAYNISPYPKLCDLA